MKKRLHKKHKAFLAVGIIATPLIVMDPYNWWLIAMIILAFLVVSFMTQGPATDKKREL